MSYKTNIPIEMMEDIERLGIYTSSTLDGYWEDRAKDDLTYVYLLGHLRATQSFQASYGKRFTRFRMIAIKRALAELKKRCQL